MIAYLNGIVKMVDENSFKNKDTNEMVEYRTIYIQVEDEDGNLKAEQINTKMTNAVNQREVREITNNLALEGYKIATAQTAGAVAVNVAGRNIYFIPPTKGTAGTSGAVGTAAADEIVNEDGVALEFGTPEYNRQKIANSAVFGNRRLLKDEREKIGNARRALNMLTIYNDLSDGTLKNDNSKTIFGERTGIISGRIRTLASQLGGDASAAAINATLIGLVPTIARGIFEEVGVLTEADVALYKQTIPNINRPENANKFVQLVLLNTLERSYTSTLTIAADNQTNVSGFLGDYNNMLQEVERQRMRVSGGNVMTNTRQTGNNLLPINDPLGLFQ